MSGSTASILLVEDDPDIRDSVSELLELEGYATVTSPNGREALAWLGRMERPCLILLDVMMPVMDGHAFMKGMRAQEHLADIPVVVTSASHKPPEGACAYVPKPIDVDELLTVVKTYCRTGACLKG
ncbi:MAG: response regulator [Cystobacter sp.]